MACVTVAGMAQAQRAAHAQPVPDNSEAQATLAHAVAIYTTAETIRANFEQTLTNTLTGTISNARGELFRRRPNLFAIVFADPPADRIVADGRTLWVYLPSSAPKQVLKSVANTANELLDPLGQLLSAPLDRYTVAGAGIATVNGHPTHAVVITPKQRDSSAFTTATVWIEDSSGIVRQIEMTESSGLTRRLVITKFTRNGTIPRSTFIFTPPSGTRVVDPLGATR